MKKVQDRMKDHGFLFKPDMIRALLEGHKTQTRRVLTRMNTNIDGHGRCSEEYWSGFDFKDAFVDPGPSPAGNPGPYLKAFNKIDGAQCRIYPTVFVGDRIWCREAWTEVMTRPFDKDSIKVVFKADGWQPKDSDYPIHWKSPLFMPKKYVRIWLDITEVRIQRVQEISQVDAIDEGIFALSNEWLWNAFPEYGEAYKKWRAEGNFTIRPPLGISPKQRFQASWNQINESRGYSWESDPWVFPYTFRRIQGE
jgi:hypothetical protein